VKSRFAYIEVTGPSGLVICCTVWEVRYVHVWKPKSKFGTNEVLSDRTALVSLFGFVKHLHDKMPGRSARVKVERHALKRVISIKRANKKCLQFVYE